MIYTFTRHIQRYEYMMNMDYLDNKTVCDVGCSFGQTMSSLCARAKHVIGIDPIAYTGALPIHVPAGKTQAEVEKMMTMIKASIFDMVIDGPRVDVLSAIEVFEHLDAPKFIDKISTLCDYAFLTTPLAKKTGPTSNPLHIAEYSAKDFDAIVSTKFDILDKKYQYADLTIQDKGKPNGDSINPEHVVQMVWCKRKGE